MKFLFAITLFISLFEVIQAFPNTMPPGFVAEDVATGLGMVTDFAFLPGNRILVTTKQGQVLLVNNGTLSGTILDISWKLGSIGGGGSKASLAGSSSADHFLPFIQFI